MNTKPIVGEHLIAETPEGRHGRTRKLEDAMVTKVGRKYFTVAIGDSGYGTEFVLETWKRSGENVHANFPINLFRTHEEMEDRNEKARLVKLISDNFRYHSDWATLDLVELREVTRVLELKHQ